MTLLFRMRAQERKPVNDLKRLRLDLLRQCKDADIRGDIFLSTDGISLQVTGLRPGLDDVIAQLRRLPGFETLSPAFLKSEHTPKIRLRIRIKRSVDDHEFTTPMPGVEKADVIPSAIKDAETISISDGMAETIRLRHRMIRQLTTPLPGSIPYDNHRPIKVPAAHDGVSLLAFLSAAFPHISFEEWRDAMSSEYILNAAHLPVTGETRVQSGELYFRLYPNTIEPDVNVGIQILYEDDALIVVNKPAPLPLHPSGRFNRNTLQAILQGVYPPERPRPAHRIDANTTGLVVFCRQKNNAGDLQSQFEKGSVQKTYLARVQGHPPRDEFFCDAPISTTPGPIGNREVDQEAGLSARTEFSVLQRCDDGSAIVQAIPLSGRTNQIRIHLWALGMPICGDAAYLPQGALGTIQTLPLDAPPLCLHAWKLGFRHPTSRRTQNFVAPPPAWASDGSDTCAA